MSTLHVETAVQNAYAAGAAERVEDLCCPVEYDPRYLAAIPDEVIERDYGCGDPSRFLREGETVLDLGSGTGKICFIASQVVGPEGRVIGVDMTPDMLDVARRNAPLVADATGFANVDFRRGRIQDLGLDLDLFEERLGETRFVGVDGLFAAEALADRLRRERPLVETGSIDVVVSNCVLNLVAAEEKSTLFEEIFRVLKRGGRAVISDIVSDEEVPEGLREDPELWSGCVSGALTETAFLDAFTDVGFYGVTVRDRQREPWRTVDGIEFRSVTIEAFKGKEGPCLERRQAVIYRGPFREVLDDDGHRIARGVRTAVCDKTYRLFSRAPYAGHFDFVDPVAPVPLDEAEAFDCLRAARRHPRETKGLDYDVTTEAGPACGPEGCC